MKNAVIYIHGKGGNVREADYYKKFFSDEHDVIGFDYKAEFPWEAKMEFPKFYEFIAPQYREIFLIANSIGAYYSMLSLKDKSIKEAMLISPIVDMEKLILNMMIWENVSEEKLYKEKQLQHPLEKRYPGNIFLMLEIIRSLGMYRLAFFMPRMII